MIFTRLTITNFGIYQGRNEFELRPLIQQGDLRPIVLFNGQNGSGKTTILEAIRLCLYGRDALGSRVRRSDYDTYIRQRMHRNADQQSLTLSSNVGLLIEHIHAGVKNTYDAVRSWRLDGQRIDEHISIYLERVQDQAQLQAHLTWIGKEINRVRQHLFSEGAGFITQRDTLEARQKEVEKQLKETHEAIRDLAANLLPFAVAPRWCLRLHERLQQEAAAEQTHFTYEAQYEQAAAVANSLLDAQFQAQTAPAVSSQDWV